MTKDRSRRPYRHANKLPYQVERTILALKKEHPGWGAPKIRDKIIRAFPMIQAPTTSTVHAVLDRNGLVKRRKRKANSERTDVAPKAEKLSSVSPVSFCVVSCASGTPEITPRQSG